MNKEFDKDKEASADIENLKNKSNIDRVDLDDTDKYLSLEQPGVQYTHDTDPTRNSDQADYSNADNNDEWSDVGGNSKNSDAFNQDDYILDDNLDLDEDQNQSISSDDDDFEESNERYTN
ncbi:hypothetical protein GR160_05420 [Flavobacterium sp. Sd200]|uniref:hypothetical protein n=1 Tax=Flavobacterium sp. Sd200 TaxID=2692211 RepID=UPI00136BF878|nr:hypothetical protein [Flavobacterium sp. Sd200]MXN90658.1 hypothetical protein [Flavobacterium sp. Sd200]